MKIASLVKKNDEVHPSVSHSGDIWKIKPNPEHRSLENRSDKTSLSSVIAHKNTPSNTSARSEGKRQVSLPPKTWATPTGAVSQQTNKPKLVELQEGNKPVPEPLLDSTPLENKRQQQQDEVTQLSIEIPKSAPQSHPPTSTTQSTASHPRQYQPKLKQKQNVHNTKQTQSPDQKVSANPTQPLSTTPQPNQNLSQNRGSSNQSNTQSQNSADPPKVRPAKKHSKVPEKKVYRPKLPVTSDDLTKTTPNTLSTSTPNTTTTPNTNSTTTPTSTTSTTTTNPTSGTLIHNQRHPKFNSQHNRQNPNAQHNTIFNTNINNHQNINNTTITNNNTNKINYPTQNNNRSFLSEASMIRCV